MRVICCAETSVTTNLYCVTSLKSEDLILREKLEITHNIEFLNAESYTYIYRCILYRVCFRIDISQSCRILLGLCLNQLVTTKHNSDVFLKLWLNDTDKGHQKRCR